MGHDEGLVGQPFDSGRSSDGKFAVVLFEVQRIVLYVKKRD